MLCHDSLAKYFEMNFAMMQHHKYSLTELDSMIPWEREIYIAFLRKHIQEVNKIIEERKRAK